MTLVGDALSLHLSREPDVGDRDVGQQFISNLDVLAHLASLLTPSSFDTLNLVEMARSQEIFMTVTSPSAVW
jgi:hypothetical protein